MLLPLPVDKVISRYEIFFFQTKSLQIAARFRFAPERQTIISILQSIDALKIAVQLTIDSNVLPLFFVVFVGQSFRRAGEELHEARGPNPTDPMGRLTCSVAIHYSCSIYLGRS